MECGQGTPKTSKKSTPLILSVLNSPPRAHLKQMHSSSNEYTLYWHTQKKIFLEANKTIVQKARLLPNLQTYEWRHQTQFPIVKTAFVFVRENESSSTTTVQITAFNEYCPLKLTQIYEMPVGQALYLLKETMLGFQRLLNRFGPFQIMSSMITINERGFCRVWLNENFALNSYSKTDATESKMVNKIITIIESHSQESKAFKKLFSSLKECSNFLQALRTIQLFIRESKIYVPQKFVTAASSSKDISRVQPPVLGKKNQSETDSPIINRLSIKDDKFFRLRDAFKQDMPAPSIRERKNSSSPIQLKRLKSQKAIAEFQPQGANKFMKISDLETAHTRKRNRTPNEAGNASPSKQLTYKYSQKVQTVKKKRHGWIEQSSYVMGQEEQTQASGVGDKKKKQLTQSEAFIVEAVSSMRKYSCKLSSSPEKKSNAKNNGVFNKKATAQHYFSQFQNILNDSELNPKTRKIKEQDEEEDKMRSAVSGSVLKNNGWTAKVSGLLDMPANLQQSFHEGQDETVVAKEVKLEKLGNMGRQQMLMSVLHQQMQDLL